MTDVQVKAALQTLQTKLDAFTAIRSRHELRTSRYCERQRRHRSRNASTTGNHETVWTSGPGDSWLQLDLEDAATGQRRPGRVGADLLPRLHRAGLERRHQLHHSRPHRLARARNQFSKTRFATIEGTLRPRRDDRRRRRYVVKELQLRESPVVTPEPKLVNTINPTEDGVIADFDATRYGADRSGRKDSTKAIQQAIYACQDAGGGTVWLPAGKYLVKDTIEVHAFCTLRGDRRDPDLTANATTALS